MKKELLVALCINVFAFQQLSAQNANKTLSNLNAPTAINQSLIPDNSLAGSNYTPTLGDTTSLKGWRALFLKSYGEIWLGGGKFISAPNGYCLALGKYALINNTSINKEDWGESNTAIGYSVLNANTVGDNNTGVGSSALYANTLGAANTAVGSLSLFSNTTGAGNSALGNQSLSSNTIGNSNSAFGSSSLNLNTSGFDNSAFGNSALYHSSTGNYNTAIGKEALASNTTADANTAIGRTALYYNTTGYNNTATGFKALYNNTSGSKNVADGLEVLYSNNTGNYNTGCGYEALYSTSATGNTAVGYAAGNSYDNSDYNTFLGYDADAGSYGYTRSTALGYGSRITASYQIRLGNSNTTSIGGYKGWSVISDGRFKKNVKENVIGLAFINKLHPITYTLDIHAIHAKTDVKENADEKKAIAESEKSIYSGFIAQEVERTANEVGFNFDGVDKPKNENDMYGLRYAEFVVPLVKAVQELSAENDELKKRLDQLERTLSSRSITGSANAEAIAKTNLSAYPNPVKNTLYIQSKESSLFYLNDATGQTVLSKQLSSNGSIDVSKLPAGVYFLRNVTTGEVQKIVVEK
ncbi:MAG TPA: T9SS type A sorting domain-containing protein [Panacibacter sp.]|nr:T9SS type A sorting domain-containing protein [Panacibacter sp.]